MMWDDVAKVLVTLLLSATIGIGFKIIYDWLKNGKIQSGDKFTYKSEVDRRLAEIDEERRRKFQDIESRLSLGASRFATMEENIKELGRRVEEHDYVKTSVLKTEILLAELSKNFEKMEKFLEKNLDEAFSRIRKLEEKQGGRP